MALSGQTASRFRPKFRVRIRDIEAARTWMAHLTTRLAGDAPCAASYFSRRYNFRIQ
jgi:hypothetical protein